MYYTVRYLVLYKYFMKGVRRMPARVPKISSIETALYIFNANDTLGNSEISELFDIKSRATIGNLKRMAFDLMEKRGVPQTNPVLVDTDTAYDAWGLDVNVMEKKLKKLMSLKLMQRQE